MADPTIEIIDERKITIPRAKQDNGATEQIGKLIVNAAQDGYSLHSVAEHKRHDMRGESYFGGVVLTFRKT